MELFVDYEKSYGGAYQGIGNVIALMQQIEANNVKCKAVGLYTGYYYFLDNAHPTITQANYLAARPLWLAWYAAPGTVRVPPPWGTWTHWQYGTPVADLGQPTQEIDANRHNGSANDFENRYLGGSVPPDNGGTMNGTAKEKLGKSSTVRSSPGVVSGNDTGLRIDPYQTIEWTELVTGTNSADDKWFLMPDGYYVQYIYAGRQYYDILSQPSDPTPPADVPAYVDATATLRDANGNVIKSYTGRLE